MFRWGNPKVWAKIDSLKETFPFFYKKALSKSNSQGILCSEPRVGFGKTKNSGTFVIPAV